VNGCFADGKHFECRFCGEADFDACPEGDSPATDGGQGAPHFDLNTGDGSEAETLPINKCSFDAPPDAPYTWDPDCKAKGRGCKADGINEECRWCGTDPYLPCPACEFANKPNVRVVWDNRCKPKEYVNGCFADGKHFECRFCGEADFDACPEGDGPATGIVTTFRTTTTATTTTETSTAAPETMTRTRGQGAPHFDHNAGNGGQGAPHFDLNTGEGGEAETAGSSPTRPVCYIAILAMVSLLCNQV